MYAKGAEQKWEDISTEDPTPDYWVRFVYGNDGWDVLCDYSSVTDLDPYLGTGTKVGKLIDKYEALVN